MSAADDDPERVGEPRDAIPEPGHRFPFPLVGLRQNAFPPMMSAPRAAGPRVGALGWAAAIAALIAIGYAIYTWMA